MGSSRCSTGTTAPSARSSYTSTCPLRSAGAPLSTRYVLGCIGEVRRCQSDGRSNAYAPTHGRCGVWTPQVCAEVRRGPSGGVECGVQVDGRKVDRAGEAAVPSRGRGPGHDGLVLAGVHREARQAGGGQRGRFARGCGAPPPHVPERRWRICVGVPLSTTCSGPAPSTSFAHGAWLGLKSDYIRRQVRVNAFGQMELRRLSDDHNTDSAEELEALREAKLNQDDQPLGSHPVSATDHASSCVVRLHRAIMAARETVRSRQLHALQWSVCGAGCTTTLRIGQLGFWHGATENGPERTCSPRYKGNRPRELISPKSLVVRFATFPSLYSRGRGGVAHRPRSA